MDSQYQQPPVQYYPAQPAGEKGHAVGVPPQEMGYPHQHQFPHGNSHSSAAYGHAHPQAVYTQAPAGAAPSSGTKRGSCFALMAALLILIAAVIGLSAGLGVSQRNLRNAQADLARATGSPAAATTVFVTARPAPTPTSTSSSSSASATPDTSTNITCPGSNNTMYTAHTGSKRFQQHCGIDFSGDQAVDVGSVKVTSMDACMDACASQANCTGAGWGYLDGDNGTEHTCWMKANLTEPHAATPAWAFAILVNGNGSDMASRGARKRRGGPSWWFWRA